MAHIPRPLPHLGGFGWVTGRGGGHYFSPRIKYEESTSSPSSSPLPSSSQIGSLAWEKRRKAVCAGRDGVCASSDSGKKVFHFPAFLLSHILRSSRLDSRPDIWILRFIREVGKPARKGGRE